MNAPPTIDLDTLLTEWKASFGGGMCPFDDAYFEAMRECPDGPQNAWTTAGAYALLDKFVEYAKRRQAGETDIWMGLG